MQTESLVVEMSRRLRLLAVAAQATGLRLIGTAGLCAAVAAAGGFLHKRRLSQVSPAYADSLSQETDYHRPTGTAAPWEQWLDYHRWLEQATELYHRARTQKGQPANEFEPVEDGVLAFAPDVPPPILRRHSARVRYKMQSTTKTISVSPLYKYEAWTFGDTVPGPMMRLRAGDVLDIEYTNKDSIGIGHNVDMHGVFGPGGGAPLLNAEAGETKHAYFKMLTPGVFIYHCAAAPVPDHVANGMYGLLVVEPEHGLPPVDKEFYVLQSEFYGEERPEDRGMLEYSYPQGLDERPRLVVFNGKEGALQERPLVASQGDRVRIFFGNAGPNLISSFHVIGAIFDKVYREGDLINPPARGIQTTLVPAGGAAVVEFNAVVPGSYTLLDHSLFRLDKGAVGFLKVLGSSPRPDLYTSDDIPRPCEGCKLHN